MSAPVTFEGSLVSLGDLSDMEDVVPDGPGLVFSVSVEECRKAAALFHRKVRLVEATPLTDAAPDLLKALEDLAHVVGEQEVGEDDGSMVALAQALDAIAKARGQRSLHRTHAIAKARGGR